ncbi:MAG: glycogen biosynthesis protein glgD, partial [Paenibacillaceae bacterium]|nr:glycogen biosynthesis protein glgD [Paenibacillaceae bacterium]
MGKNVLGLIDVSGSTEELGVLAHNRCLSAVPFGGKYRLVDWVLSSLTNAGIDQIALCGHRVSRELLEHVGSGQDWDLHRRAGLTVLADVAAAGSSDAGAASSLAMFRQHLPYFLSSPRNYIFLAKGNIVANIDMARVIKQHRQSGARITKLVSAGRAIGAYLLEKELFLQMLRDPFIGAVQTFEDAILQQIPIFDMATFEVEGFAAAIDSISSYYQSSLKLLQPEVLKNIFSKIRSRKRDDPSTIYHGRTMVRNSLIAGGCVIEGQVENSILFRGVHVGKDSVIKNSIVMSHE